MIYIYLLWIIDPIRRGYPSCYVRFREFIAILAGNALHTLDFTILSKAHIPNINNQDRLKMITTLASAIGANGLYLGQSLNLTIKNNQNISFKKLKTIYQHKISSLIRASVRIGTLAVGNKSHRILKLLDYHAKTIGLAYQIQDDIIDIIYDSKKNI